MEEIGDGIVIAILEALNNKGKAFLNHSVFKVHLSSKNHKVERDD